jgi:hypothetical protein
LTAVLGYANGMAEPLQAPQEQVAAPRIVVHYKQPAGFDGGGHPWTAPEAWRSMRTGWGDSACRFEAAHQEPEELPGRGLDRQEIRYELLPPPRFGFLQQQLTVPI